MTVAGQKNYYNVKLLKGYGLGIRVKCNKVTLAVARVKKLPGRHPQKRHEF